MKTFLSFTTSGMMPILRETVPTHLKLDGGSRVVLAFGKNDHFSKGSIEAIGKGNGGELYTRPTEFNRGGSLNGWECVIGILETVIEVCEKFSTPGLFKVDSDTLVRATGWAPEATSMAGFNIGRRMKIQGACYWIRKDAAQAALSHMKGRWRQAVKIGEDDAISSEIFYLQGYGLAPALSLDAQMTGSYRSWAWENPDVPDLERYKRAQVIHFGKEKSKSPAQIGFAIKRFQITNTYETTEIHTGQSNTDLP